MNLALFLIDLLILISPIKDIDRNPFGRVIFYYYVNILFIFCFILLFYRLFMYLKKKISGNKNLSLILLLRKNKLTSIIFFVCLVYYVYLFIILKNYFFQVWTDSLDFCEFIQNAFRDSYFGYPDYDLVSNQGVFHPIIGYPYYGFIIFYAYLLIPFGSSILNIFIANKLVAFSIPFLTIILAYVLTKSFKASILPLILFLFFKDYFLFSQTIFSNYTQVFFMLISLIFFFIYLRNNRLIDLIIFFLFLNLLFMTRQEMIVFGFFLFVYLICKKGLTKKYIIFFAIQVLLILLFIFPLFAQNRISNFEEGCWTPIAFMINARLMQSQLMHEWFIHPLLIFSIFFFSVIFGIKARTYRDKIILFLMIILFYFGFYMLWKPADGSNLRVHLIWLVLAFIFPSLIYNKFASMLSDKKHGIIQISLMVFLLMLSIASSFSPILYFPKYETVFMPNILSCVEKTLASYEKKPTTSLLPRIQRVVNSDMVFSWNNIFNNNNYYPPSLKEGFYYVEYSFLKRFPEYNIINSTFPDLSDDFTYLPLSACSLKDRGIYGDFSAIYYMNATIYLIKPKKV
ncbi:hypothetical protein JXB41_03160 [Candidatus Woesearchaeota archaeon]|nr:hypothetical protein [Candidatus Woesearchaeota archaeon]